MGGWNRTSSDSGRAHWVLVERVGLACPRPTSSSGPYLQQQLLYPAGVLRLPPAAGPTSGSEPHLQQRALLPEAGPARAPAAVTRVGSACFGSRALKRTCVALMLNGRL